MHWLWSLRDPVATKSSLLEIRMSGRIPDIERLHAKMKTKIERMPYYGLGHVSDKVKELVKLLQTYKDKKGFSCIIFVQQRHHAYALATLISKSQSLQSFIRASYLVGHGMTGEERLNSEGMDAKHVSRPVIWIIMHTY
jgi:superfamily II DNA/RNA helicase